jgi:hypothetical protein
MNFANAIPALACVPGAIAPGDRQAHFSLAKELFHQRALERVALPNGYAARFPIDALEAVARFVANERKCCPFMCFEISFGPESAPLWLRMTGPDGTKDVLDAEFNLTSCCGCG